MGHKEDMIPTHIGSTAAEICDAVDVLFAAYESNRENWELMATVFARSRPEFNPLGCPNASPPRGYPPSYFHASGNRIFTT